VDVNAPVTLHLRDARLQQVLKQLAREAGGTVALDIAIDGNALVFTTAEDAAKFTIVRAYDVEDLLSAATTRPGAEGSTLAAQSLVHLIMENVEPDSWRDNGGLVGSISEFGALLVVKTTLSNHLDVDDLLRQMRTARKGGLRPHLSERGEQQRTSVLFQLTERTTAPATTQPRSE
jgi:hypothetical protein